MGTLTETSCKSHGFCCPKSYSIVTTVTPSKLVEGQQFTVNGKAFVSFAAILHFNTLVGEFNGYARLGSFKAINPS